MRFWFPLRKSTISIPKIVIRTKEKKDFSFFLSLSARFDSRRKIADVISILKEEGFVRDRGEIFGGEAMIFGEK